MYGSTLLFWDREHSGSSSAPSTGIGRGIAFFVKCARDLALKAPAKTVIGDLLWWTGALSVPSRQLYKGRYTGFLPSRHGLSR